MKQLVLKKMSCWLHITAIFFLLAGPSFLASRIKTFTLDDTEKMAVKKWLESYKFNNVTKDNVVHKFNKDAWIKAIKELTGLTPADLMPQSFFDRYSRNSDSIFDWPMLKPLATGISMDFSEVKNFYKKLLNRKKKYEAPVVGFGNFPKTEGNLTKSLLGKGTEAIVTQLGSKLVGESSQPKGFRVVLGDDKPGFIAGIVRMANSMISLGSVSRLKEVGYAESWLIKNRYLGQNDQEPTLAYGAWCTGFQNRHNVEESYCMGNGGGPDHVGTALFGTPKLRELFRRTIGTWNYELPGQSNGRSTRYSNDYIGYDFYKNDTKQGGIDLPFINHLLNNRSFILKCIASYQSAIDKTYLELTDEKTVPGKLWNSQNDRENVFRVERKDGPVYVDRSKLMKTLFGSKYEDLFSLKRMYAIAQANPEEREKYLRAIPGLEMPKIPESLNYDKETISYYSGFPDLYDFMDKKLPAFFSGVSPFKTSALSSFKKSFNINPVANAIAYGSGKYNKDKDSDSIDQFDVEEEDYNPETACSFTYPYLDGPTTFKPKQVNMLPSELHEKTKKPLLRTGSYVKNPGVNLYYEEEGHEGDPTSFCLDLNNQKNTLIKDPLNMSREQLRKLYEDQKKQFFYGLPGKKVSPEELKKGKGKYHLAEIQLKAKVYKIKEVTKMVKERQPELDSGGNHVKINNVPQYKMVPVRKVWHEVEETKTTVDINRYKMDPKGPPYNLYTSRSFPKPEKRTTIKDPETKLSIPIFCFNFWSNLIRCLTDKKLLEGYSKFVDRDNIIKKFQEKSIEIQDKLQLVKKEQDHKFKLNQKGERRKQQISSMLWEERFKNILNYVSESGVLVKPGLLLLTFLSILIFVYHFFPQALLSWFKEPLPVIVTDHNLPSDSLIGRLRDALFGRKKAEWETGKFKLYYTKEVQQQLDKIKHRAANAYAYELEQLRNGFSNAKAEYANFLLHGPPGCGKTGFFKEIVRYFQARFKGKNVYYVILPGGGLLQGDPSVIMKNFVNLFRKLMPLSSKPGNLVLFFIDEMDSIMPARGGPNATRTTDQLTSYFLSLFPNAYTKGMLVLGALNRTSVFDEAAQSRFGGPGFFISRPDKEALKKMIKFYLIKWWSSTGRDLLKLGNGFLDEKVLNGIATDLQEKRYTGRLVDTQIMNCVKDAISENRERKLRGKPLKRLTPKEFMKYFPTTEANLEYEREEAISSGRLVSFGK